MQRSATNIKQLGLGLNLSTKKTRKPEFLEEMEHVVASGALSQVLEPCYPKAKTGRPPFGIETMLRIHDIILNLAGRTIGMVIDSVNDVLALGPDQIKAAPEFNGQIECSHMIGLGAVKTGEVERMMILMDIEGLMSSDGMGLRDLPL